MIKLHYNENYGGDGLGILFNENRQILTCAYAKPSLYEISCFEELNFINKYNFLEMQEKELKIGYTYFRTDSPLPMFQKEEEIKKHLYCKYLGFGNYLMIQNDKNILIGDLIYKYRYQIIPVKRNT